MGLGLAKGLSTPARAAELL